MTSALALWYCAAVLESCSLLGLVAYARFCGRDRNPLRTTTNYKVKESKALSQRDNRAESAYVEECHARAVKAQLKQVALSDSEARLLDDLLHCLAVYPALPEAQVTAMHKLDQKLRAALAGTGELEMLWSA